MEEGYLREQQVGYAVYLLIQKDGDTIHLPPLCPHAVLAFRLCIILGTDHV